MPSKNIQKLLLELDNIEKQLLKKLNEIDRDANYEKILDLMADYPEHKTLIKFIIKINDNITNSQTKITDTLTDTISEMIESKKKILQIIDDVHTQPKKSSSKKVDLSKIPKEGWFIIGISFIAFLTFLFLIFHPEKTDTIVQGAVKITKEKK